MSGNLADRPGGLADVDIIRAMGIVSTSDPLAVRVYRLRHTQDPRELPEIVGGLRKLLIDDQPRLPWAVASRTVERALAHWLAGVCSSCEGRGYRLMPAAPVLSDQVCLDCAGQGRAALERATDLESWLLGRLAEMERHVASAVARLLA
jgi:hypothetical protein